MDLKGFIFIFSFMFYKSRKKGEMKEREMSFLFFFFCLVILKVLCEKASSITNRKVEGKKKLSYTECVSLYTAFSLFCFSVPFI